MLGTVDVLLLCLAAGVSVETVDVLLLCLAAGVSVETVVLLCLAAGVSVGNCRCVVTVFGSWCKC